MLVLIDDKDLVLPVGVLPGVVAQVVLPGGLGGVGAQALGSDQSDRQYEVNAIQASKYICGHHRCPEADHDPRLLDKLGHHGHMFLGHF